MNAHLIKALSDAYQSGGALARFTQEPDVRVNCMDDDDKRYTKELSSHLKQMLVVIDAILAE